MALNKTRLKAVLKRAEADDADAQFLLGTHFDLLASQALAGADTGAVRAATLSASISYIPSSVVIVACSLLPLKHRSSFSTPSTVALLALLCGEQVAFVMGSSLSLKFIIFNARRVSLLPN